MRVLRAHPCASQLLVATGKQSESALQAIEITLEVLRRGGFDPDRAAEVASSVLWTGLMLVMNAPGFDPALTAEARTEMQRRKKVQLALLSPDRFPRLVEAAIPLTACDDPEFHYRFGMDLFIAGVQAVAQRH